MNQSTTTSSQYYRTCKSLFSQPSKISYRNYDKELGHNDGRSSSHAQKAAISSHPERLFEQDDIRRVLEDMDDGKKELLEKLSQSDEDILQYLNSTVLENEPTEVLIK